MDLRRLEHFLAVYRRRSFGQAAAEEGLTPSAITRSVQKLEAELGVVLFSRSTRTVHPTEAGERLARHASSVIAGADGLRAEARALREGAAGAIRIGASGLALEGLIAETLAAHPPGAELALSVETGSRERLTTGLLDRTYDFVCLGVLGVPGFGYEGAISVEELAMEDAVIAAGRDHPLVLSQAPSWAYLDHPWVSPQLNAPDFEVFPPDYREEMRRRGIPQLRLESLSACMTLVAEAGFLTGLPLSTARRWRRWLGVALIAYPFPVKVRYCLLRLRSRPLLPAAQDLQRRLQQRALALSKQTLSDASTGDGGY